MRARTAGWLFWLITLAFGTAVSEAGASAQRSLGWSWDQVSFRQTDTGGVKCAVEGASLHLSEPGEPDLPAYLVDVEAAEGTRVASFEIVGGLTSVQDLPSPIVPALRYEPTEAGGPVFVPPLSEAYGARAFPATRVRYLGLSLRRGVVWAGFAVYPLVLENGTQVRLLEQGTLTIRWESDPAAPIPLKSLREVRGPVGAPPGAPQVPPVPAGVISDRPSLNSAPVDYLVLTVESLADSVQPLVNWKNRMGTPATLRTVEWVLDNYPEGADQPERIRNFLREAYSYWGIHWLLIAGGPELVPIRYAKYYSHHAPYGVDILTDYYYACLDGTWNADGDAFYGEPYRGANPFNPVGDNPDFAPELYVGRIPATSPEQMGRWMRRYLRYVQNPDTGGYLDQFLFMAEVLFDKVIVVVDHAEFAGAIDVARAQEAARRAREQLERRGDPAARAEVDLYRAEVALKRAENRLRVARRGV